MHNLLARANSELNSGVSQGCTPKRFSSKGGGSCELKVARDGGNERSGEAESSI